MTYTNTIRIKQIIKLLQIIRESKFKKVSLRLGFKRRRALGQTVGASILTVWGQPHWRPCHLLCVVWRVEWRGDVHQRNVVNRVACRGEEDRIGGEAPGHEGFVKTRRLWAEFWTYWSFFFFFFCFFFFNLCLGKPRRRLLQWSNLDETKAWMSVSVTEWDRAGQSLELFLRWKKAVFVMFLICESKQRVESKGIPTFVTSATEGVMKMYLVFWWII